MYRVLKFNKCQSRDFYYYRSEKYVSIRFMENKKGQKYIWRTFHHFFLLSPRNPNPTIAQRNTSFPLGAFYPHVMFLYFLYWTIYWIYLTYNACISYFITEGKFPWEVSGKLRSTWFRTEQSACTCTSPSLIQDLNFKNFDDHFLYSAVHSV